MQPVNIEAKNLLARLLATENLYIRHKKVKTAFFNTVTRVLTFPIWKTMSDELYTMLAGHEVGHALWTARQRLDDVARQIDPKNIHIAAAYVNIVEDARIERLIKSMYPGLRRIFAIAYADLLERDFFGLRKSDPNYRCFIDRANLYFKVGEHVSLTFTDEEKSLLQKIETTDTFEDVIRVSKQIYEWAKQNNEHPEPAELPQELIDQLKEMLKNGQLPEADEDGDGDGEGGLTIEIPMEGEEDEDAEESEGDGDPSGSGDEDSEGNGAEDSGEKQSGDGEDGESESADADGDDGAGEDGESDDGGKDGSESKSAQGKSKSGSNKKDQSKSANGKSENDGKKNGKTGQNNKQGKNDPTRYNNQKLKPVDPGPPPMPITNQHFEENVKKLNDDRASEITYVSTPTPILKNILVDYKEVHSNLRNYFGDPAVKHSKMAQAEAEFAAFRQQNNDKINYIFTQFEMKKQAARYLRTRVHKTGSLDMLRLHAYKYEDDLFRSIATVTDAKNHALLFVIDWSMSMQESMAGTIEQLINLTMFCRKAQIPFEVYSLTTGSRKAFQCKAGDMKYADNFRMRNYLSSRMNQKEFFEACLNLFALMPSGSFRGGPTADNLIGCTPLDEAIVTAMELIKEIRQRTRAEVVNAVFLTDGGANTVSEYLDEDGDTQYMGYRERYVVEDRLTRKHYEFSHDYGSMTPRMLEILRDRQNINAVGFYVTDRFVDYFFDGDDDKLRKQHEKDFKENGCCVSTSWGFNELYILKGGARLKVKTADFNMRHEPGSPKYMEEAMSKLSNFGKSTLKERLMLDRFVKMIA